MVVIRQVKFHIWDLWDQIHHRAYEELAKKKEIYKHSHIVQY